MLGLRHQSGPRPAEADGQLSCLDCQLEKPRSHPPVYSYACGLLDCLGSTAVTALHVMDRKPQLVQQGMQHMGVCGLRPRPSNCIHKESGISKTACGIIARWRTCPLKSVSEGAPWQLALSSMFGV